MEQSRHIVFGRPSKMIDKLQESLCLIGFIIALLTDYCHY